MHEDDAFRRLVGRRLRRRRRWLELSQDELAVKAGVTRAFISAVERAAQGLDAVRLRRIAEVLDLRLGELLADPDESER